VPPESFKILSGVSVVIGVIVVAYVYSKFFGENIFLSILKYLLTYILTIIMIMILDVVVLLIHAMLIKYAVFEKMFMRALKMQQRLPN
tara:strand:+ start:1140 stop:1403 length:264 start_codon:yes stop_codon:yes gene_type:complete